MHARSRRHEETLLGYRGGRCPGSVRTSDMAKIAAILESGGTVKRAPFFIPAKCDTKWASIGVRVNYNTRKVTFNAWNKYCIKADQASVEAQN